MNNVTSVNTNKLQQVIDLINTIPATYGLQSDFADIFTPGASENGKRSLFAVQFSDKKGDGTMFGRLNFGDVLATPMGIGCCDFHKPSKNLANAFKTDANGLPLFDTYDATPINPAADKVDAFESYNCNTRSSMNMIQQRFIRKVGIITPDGYGVYASLKENVCKTCYTQVGPFYGNTKNRIILRYADVTLLWKAEALIEIKNLESARQIINSIRTRAKNSTARLKVI